MIDPIPFEAPNVIGFKVNGSIDDEGFRQAVNEIETALKNDQPVRVYAEVEALGGLSIDTFFENLKFKFQLFGQLDRFEKEAIVSDKRWIETLTKAGDKLFPSIEVKYFSFAQKDEALAWITG